MTRTRIAVIYNPRAGLALRRSRSGSELHRLLAAEDFSAEWLPTRGPGDGMARVKQALKRGVDMVVACGGDGTVNEIACGLAGSPVPLGLLPIGTANVFAAEMHIPTSLRAAVKVLREGQTRRISLGQAGSRYFVLMAGIGLDAAIVAGMPPSWKSVLGKFGFFLHGFRYWLQNPILRFCLEIDGERVEAGFAVLANSRHYGGGLKMTPHADPFDDFLEVCIFPSQDKKRYLRYLWAAAVGRMEKLPEVIVKKIRRARGIGPQGIGVQADGECIGNLPMAFSILPAGLAVMLPAEQPGVPNPIK